LTYQAIPKNKKAADSANSRNGAVLPIDGQIAATTASSPDAAMAPAQAT